MKINKETYNRNLKTFMAHEVIFREGEIGSYMYVILDGEIEIRKRVDAKTTRTMITLRKGDFFGEMSVIDKKPRSATAVTVSGCRLLRVDVKVFHELIQRNPDFAMKMIKTLSSRLRNTDSILEEVMSVDIQRRILAGVGAYLQGQGNVHEGKSFGF